MERIVLGMENTIGLKTRSPLVLSKHDWLKIAVEKLLTPQETPGSLTYVSALTLDEEDYIRTPETHSRPTSPSRLSSDEPLPTFNLEESEEDDRDCRSREEYYADFSKDHEHIATDADPCSVLGMSRADYMKDLDGCESDQSQQTSRSVTSSNQVAAYTRQTRKTVRTRRCRPTSVCIPRASSTILYAADHDEESFPTRDHCFNPKASSTMIHQRDTSMCKALTHIDDSGSDYDLKSICMWSITEDVAAAEDSLGATYVATQTPAPETLHFECDRVQVVSKSKQETRQNVHNIAAKTSNKKSIMKKFKKFGEHFKSKKSPELNTLAYL